MPRYRKKSERRRYSNSGGSGVSVIMEGIKNISPETRKGIFIIVIFLVGALSALGLFDLSGRFGQFTNYLLSISMGNIKWLVPALLGAWIFFLLNEEKYPIKFINYFGVGLFLLTLAGLFHLPYDSWASLETAKAGNGGGYLGVAIALPLIRLMTVWGAGVVLVAGLLVGILLALETSIYGILWPIKVAKWLGVKIKDWYYYRRMRRQERLLEASTPGYEEEEAANVETEEELPEESLAEVEPEDEVVDENEPGFVKKEIKMSFSGGEDLVPQPARPKKYGPIDIPIGLLNARVGKATAGDIKSCQEVIRKTLSNFGIPVEMGDVNIGPTVTQYTMRPVDGVRLSKITTLNADMALALAAHPIRIEAPIPGKSLVGIEVPNVISAKVTMGEMLLSKEYKTRTNNLQIALGKDVSGKAIFAQLDKMPHLLVAGATGSGKSVCINSIIISLIYQNSPDELKFILVDPKRVELPGYNAIPYLLTPVITDVKKTIGSLKWAITEMERRFELLAKFGNRNISSYNQSHADKIPYIVIVIDELADLMASAGADMEAGIVRLAQMSRAVGIHLILATQRPSTEVITGLIKANIPARISFSVASSIDSRTILDGSGAEKLVGRGDMLYLGPEYSKPKRIQGVYLSDKEIGDVVKYIKSHGEVEYVEALSASSNSGSYGGGGGGFGSDSDEPILAEAIEVIKESGKASASLLQRRLKLGYARAARILDILEEKGMIGPSDGAKPREVFLDQLGGGVNPLEFSAREHNLTGELRARQEEEEIAPVFSSPYSQSGFRGGLVEEDQDNDNLSHSDLEPESEPIDALTDEDEDDFNNFTSKDIGEDEPEETEDEVEAESENFAEIAEPEVDEPEEEEVEQLSEELEAMMEASEIETEPEEAEDDPAEDVPIIKVKKIKPEVQEKKKKFFADDEW